MRVSQWRTNRDDHALGRSRGAGPPTPPSPCHHGSQVGTVRATPPPRRSYPPEGRVITNDDNSNSSMVGFATVGAFVLALLAFLGISDIGDLEGDAADTSTDDAACEEALDALEVRSSAELGVGAPAWWAYAQGLEGAAADAENEELRTYLERDAAVSRAWADAVAAYEGYLFDSADQTQRQLDQASWVEMCTE